MNNIFSKNSPLKNPKIGAETVQFLKVEAEVHPEMESAVVTAFCRRTPNLLDI